LLVRDAEGASAHLLLVGPDGEALGIVTGYIHQQFGLGAGHQYALIYIKIEPIKLTLIGEIGDGHAASALCDSMGKCHCDLVAEWRGMVQNQPGAGGVEQVRQDELGVEAGR
jgi:hypothetical protein